MSFGQAELESMLERGDLELCPPDEDGARALIGKAQRHHATAQEVAFEDPEIAASALHAGNRKALAAVLLARGLRPSKTGGHIAPLEAVRAMLGGGGRAAGRLAVYDVVRRLRHEGEYTATDVHPDDIIDNLSDAQALVESYSSTIGSLPVFAVGRS